MSAQSLGSCDNPMRWIRVIFAVNQAWKWAAQGPTGSRCWEYDRNRGRQKFYRQCKRLQYAVRIGCSPERATWAPWHLFRLSGCLVLQRTGRLLEQSTQGCEEHLRAIDEFTSILVRTEVLAHKDKVCISACLVSRWYTLLRNERCTVNNAISYSWQQVTHSLLLCRM